MARSSATWDDRVMLEDQSDRWLACRRDVLLVAGINSEIVASRNTRRQLGLGQEDEVSQRRPKKTGQSRSSARWSSPQRRLGRGEQLAVAVQVRSKTSWCLGKIATALRLRPRRGSMERATDEAAGSGNGKDERPWRREDEFRLFFSDATTTTHYCRWRGRLATSNMGGVREARLSREANRSSGENGQGRRFGGV